MKACLVRDLPVLSSEQELRALASRHAATHVYEEPGDSVEMVQALMNFGRAVIARKAAVRRMAEEKAEEEAALHQHQGQLLGR